MLPLFVDEGKLRALRAYAEARPIGRDEFRRILAGEAPCPGDRPGHVALLSINYRVVFAIEETPLYEGQAPVWIRHMTVSFGPPGRSPHTAALEEVGKVLGFPPLGYCEVFADPSGAAIAVVAERGKSFTCPDCGRTSFHLEDARHRYCAACGRWY